MLLIASDIDIEQKERFLGCPQTKVPLESALLDACAVLRGLVHNAS